MPRKAASATRTNTPTRSFTAISPLSSFIDSPRLRLRLALPHSSTRLASGSGSHCHIHRLASAPARTATFIDSPSGVSSGGGLEPSQFAQALGPARRLAHDARDLVLQPGAHL